MRGPRESRLISAAFAVGVVLLAVGPLGITLLRAEDYRSSATISFAAGSSRGVEPQRALNLLSRLLESRVLQAGVAKDVGWFDAPAQLPDYVTVTEERGRRGPAFVVTGHGPSASEARELTLFTAASLNGFAQDRAASLRRLERGQVDRAVQPDDPVFAAHPSLPNLPEERIVDRIIAALPGGTPPRPKPAAAGLAGLGLALALMLWIPVVRSRVPAWRRGPASAS